MAFTARSGTSAIICGSGSIFSLLDVGYTFLRSLVHVIDGIVIKPMFAHVMNKHFVVVFALVPMNVNELVVPEAGSMFFLNRVSCGNSISM